MGLPDRAHPRWRKVRANIRAKPAALPCTILTKSSGVPLCSRNGYRFEARCRIDCERRESVMLDNREAGADTRSAGLLAGVNPIAATAGGGTEAIITDLANLASACAGVGGLDLLYICGPSAAVKIALLAPLLKIPVTCSAAVRMIRLFASRPARW